MRFIASYKKADVNPVEFGGPLKCGKEGFHLATASGSNVPPLPAEALVFRFPRSLTWFMFAGFLMFLGFAALTVILTLTYRFKPIPGALAVVVFGLFAAFSLRSFRRFRDSVAVTSDGAWYLPRKGDPTFLAWGDVATMKVDDTMQRLVLLDATGTRRIRMEYQIERFGQLRDFVVSHTAHIRLCSPVVTVFHRTWLSMGVLLVFSGIFLIGARQVPQDQHGTSRLLIGMAVLSLFAIAQDPIRVVIEVDAVVIQYLGWKRTIPFSAIAGIELTDMLYRGNMLATVIVKSKSQRKYRVDGLDLWVLGSPGGGRQFCDALDRNPGEAGKDSSQVVACR